MVYLVMEDDNVKGVYATRELAVAAAEELEQGVTAHRHTYSVVAREVKGGPVAAAIVPNTLPVLAAEGMNREIIRVAIPGGYDDVKKYSKLVLDFEGKQFTFTGWNSDTLEAYFKTGGAVATTVSSRRSSGPSRPLTETDYVNLSETDTMRQIQQDKARFSFYGDGLKWYAASYAEDALKMIPDHVRLYARIAFRLARRAYGEAS